MALLEGRYVSIIFASIIPKKLTRAEKIRSLHRLSWCLRLLLATITAAICAQSCASLDLPFKRAK